MIPRPMMPEAPITINLDGLISMSTRLAEILTIESALLRDMKLKEIMPLQTEKINLSRTIGMQQQQLQSHPELLSGVDPAALDRLLNVTEELQDIISENMRLNDIARTVNQRVVNVISNALREQQRPTTYNRYGSTRTAEQVPVSINLNQQA